jgi:hypothetical protein
MKAVEVNKMSNDYLNGIEKFESLIQLSEISDRLDKPTFADVFAVTGSEQNIPAPKHQAVVSSLGRGVLSVVSNKYQIVQSGSIVKDVCSALSKLGIHEVTGSVVEQKGRTFVKVLLPKYISETATKKLGQDIQLGFTLINSYDATRSLRMFGSAFRLVCTNGMVMPRTLGTAFVHKHIGESLSLHVEVAVTKIVSEIVERSEYLKTVIAKATEEMFPDDEEISKALSEYGYGDKTIDKILECVKYIKDGATSRWEVYNAITSYYSHKKISENARITALEKAEDFLVCEAV